MTEQARWVINCVTETRGRYGQTIVIGTLLGANRARLKELGTIHYKSYGALKDKNQAELKSLISELILKGYLYQTEDQYSVLKLGNIKPLQDESTKIMVRMYAEKEPSRKEKSNKCRRTDALTSDGFELFEALRKLRLEIAKEEAVPPYIVFSDKTLIDMCGKLPQNQSEMLDVSGVGAAKYERYGERFMDVIKKFQVEHANVVTRTKISD